MAPHMVLHVRRRGASLSRSSSLRCVCCCIMFGDITRSVEQPDPSPSSHSHCRPCWHCDRITTTSQLHTHSLDLTLERGKRYKMVKCALISFRLWFQSILILQSEMIIFQSILKLTNLFTIYNHFANIQCPSG